MVTPAEALKSVNHTVVDDAVDDDWTIVVRRRNNHNRKFPKLKSPKQQEAQIQEQTQWTPTDVETTPERELKLMQRIQNTIEKLESSYFFYIFFKQICSPEVLECFRKLRGSDEKIKMVIYGIGSIEAYEGPRLQLSLAILMKRKLDWIGEMEVFDPVISLTESKVLEELGCCVLSVNEGGSRQAVNPILFFMPHCDAWLYDNLLKANWRYDMLNQIALLGNSFEKYEEDRSYNMDMGMDTRKHLYTVLPFTTQFDIRVFADEYYPAFQNSSWQFFNVDPDTNLELKC
ncbi:protein sensitivity to red light reduced 1 [Tanacetum coccineum]